MPKKPQETGVMKPVPKPPRERLSLPLTPHLTKAVQAIAKAYGRPQAQVLAGLMELAAPLLARKLEELQATYEATQRQALADVLGAPATATGMSPEALASWEAEGRSGT
jgi:hypothetical protein